MLPPEPWRRRLPRDISTLAAVALLAFAIGYWNQSHATYARALAALPLIIALFCRPQVPFALGVATLPLLLDVVGGTVHLTISDVLLSITLVAAIPPLLLRRDWRQRIGAASPLLVAAVPLTAWLLAVVIDHASLTNVLKTGQYYQLFLLPILLGAVVVEARVARYALAGFVATALVVAILWTATGGHFSFAADKNPAGQMIADALILTFALAPSWLWRLIPLIPLGLGLAFTQSRGAILAAGVGVVVVVAFRGLGSWKRTIAAVVPLAVLVGVGYQLLPEDIQARATEYSSGSSATSLADLTSAQYAVRLREIYRENGWKLVNANPVFGVGPGNYHTGAPGSPEENTDPHDLIIRTAGDAGYPGLVGFAILVAGSAYVVVRRRSLNPYVVVALAIQASLITHGFVDVYWVRGTPVLGWLLIGMAVNRRLDYRSDRPERDRSRLSQRRSAPSLPVLTPPRPLGVGGGQFE